MKRLGAALCMATLMSLVGCLGGDPTSTGGGDITPDKGQGDLAMETGAIAHDPGGTGITTLNRGPQLQPLSPGNDTKSWADVVGDLTYVHDIIASTRSENITVLNEDGTVICTKSRSIDGIVITDCPAGI